MIPIISSRLHSKTFNADMCKIKCTIMKQIVHLNDTEYKKCIDKCNKLIVK